MDRIVNVFPAKRQEQVRTMLSEGLRMVVSQRLVRTSKGDGRVAAAEVLINTHAVATLIRNNRTHQLQAVIKTGTKDGMQCLDRQLQRLVQAGAISGREAYRHAIDKGPFEHMLSREAPAA